MALAEIVKATARTTPAPGLRQRGPQTPQPVLVCCVWNRGALTAVDGTGIAAERLVVTSAMGGIFVEWALARAGGHHPSPL